MNERFLEIIEKSIKKNWENPALTDYGGETYLYKDFAKKIAELHIMFDALGIQKGDKVALCGRNMANWAVTLFGTLTYGAVAVTILHEFNPENIYNIINHSEAKVFFTGKYVWEKLSTEEIPNVSTIIEMDDFSVIKSSSKELIEVAHDIDLNFKEKYPDGFTKEDLKFYIEEAEELAILNYTSGTTSKPKGVMIPYRSLWSNTRFAIDKIPFVKTGSGIVCMLPMAHMYGLAFEVLLSISKGCHIHFLTRVPSPQVITEAFSRVRPPLILAVPLIIEKIIRNNVFPKLEKQPVKLLLKIPFINKIIYKKILSSLLNIFGGNLEEVVIGGAALNKEVGDFLTKIKFPYTVGYGLTECGPLISYEYWETYKPMSCGRMVDRMEIIIESADTENIAGEIIVKGTNVMLGYFKNEEETKKVLSKDGWLKTGDLGTMDKDGFIFIKGRNKSMILGPSGQNIYPEDIEDLINSYSYIAESLVVERDRKLVALITPDYDQIKSAGIKENKIEAILEQQIKSINKRLPSYSQISDIKIQTEGFEKTPKQSIRRFLYQ
ncbi:MAG: AMP-binding protein [Dysgonomonas sp.]